MYHYSSTQSLVHILQIRSSLGKPLNTLLGLCYIGHKDERANNKSLLQCKAVTKRSRAEDYKDGFLPNIKGEKALDVVTETNKLKQQVDSIISTLRSLNDGDISISAYDTAWVALVEDIHGNGGPLFSKSLEWICNNQLPDGSWGDSLIFEAHDRLISTLACVIALKSWNFCPDKSNKGVEFIIENMHKLEDTNPEHMTIGFEVAFPSLIEMGRKLNMELPVDDSPILQRIYAMRNLKFSRIPKDILHSVPTTLIYSLEGMPGLEWEKLLKLRCPNGSFLFSPSSTAFALMQTKDDKCFRYLSEIVEKFNGGVPHAFPNDLFERLWVVDRLERLGISRYFQLEIKEYCLDYVYRYWTEKGIFSARCTTVEDIDDTAMGFRLLRRYGYQVSANVFRHFEKDGEFFCFPGQSTQGLSPMYNLYRASQVLFPEEKILEDAKKFTSEFLREQRASNKLLDKWLIAKGFPGEVEYALDVPWFANLPRLETRFYLEQYGGEDDVWIGKTLYRMPNINNNKYLELAKLDYKNCQALHLLEWDAIQTWYAERSLGEFGMGKRNLLIFAYYLATASIFEIEKSKERLAWTKTKILMETIVSYFENEGNSIEQRSAFLCEFREIGSIEDCANNVWHKGIIPGQELVSILLRTLNQLLVDAQLACGEDMRDNLHQAWEMWILSWQNEGDMHRKEAELIVHTINLCANRGAPEKLSQLSHPRYKLLSDVTNEVCYQLLQFQYQKPSCNEIHDNDEFSKTPWIESGMQKLVKLVLCASADDIDPDIKNTFLAVAKSYYYVSHFSHATIDCHIAKVLFEPVI